MAPKEHPRTAVRLTPMDKSLLAALSAHYGLTTSATIRLLIREQARDFGYLAGAMPVDAPPGRPARPS